MADETERRSSATADEAHAWFDEHGADAAGLWMLLDTTRAFPSVTWEEFTQVLLCHGWIDGRSNRFDDTGHLIRTTPAAPPGARPAVDAPTRSE
ncbi:MAG: OmdA domain containing protein, partial [Klenkia sp.]|nr:OmdA domain containing protein [Klenkia sp.]